MNVIISQCYTIRKLCYHAQVRSHRTEKTLDVNKSETQMGCEVKNSEDELQLYCTSNRTER